MSGGFRPVQDRSGHDYTGKIETYSVAAGHTTLMAVGDLVIETGDLDVKTGLAEVDTISAAGLITGVIVSIDYDMNHLERKGLPAGEAGTLKVAVDTDMYLLAETSGGEFAVDDVGGNVDVSATAAARAGNLVNSTMTVNMSSPATSASAQVRLIGVPNSEIVTYPAPSGLTIICRINESTSNEVGV